MYSVHCTQLALGHRLLCAVDSEQPPGWQAEQGKQSRAIKNYWGHRCTGTLAYIHTRLRKAPIATSGHKMTQAARINTVRTDKHKVGGTLKAQFGRVQLFVGAAGEWEPSERQH